MYAACCISAPDVRRPLATANLSLNLALVWKDKSITEPTYVMVAGAVVVGGIEFRRLNFGNGMVAVANAELCVCVLRGGGWYKNMEDYNCDNGKMLGIKKEKEIFQSPDKVLTLLPTRSDRSIFLSFLKKKK